MEPDFTDVDVAVARTEPTIDGTPGVREIEVLYIAAPDILCLQERKSPIQKMSLEPFRALGYGDVVARRQTPRAQQSSVSGRMRRMKLGRLLSLFLLASPWTAASL